jgi:hypothetical protein
MIADLDTLLTLFGHARYGYCPSHSRWYSGAKLLIICTRDGTVTGFSLANPKLHGERDQARQTLDRQPASRPAPGTAIVGDHGGRIPAGLWARIIQRLLAPNACSWHNWQIGASVKRSLIAYDHV